MGLNIVGKRPLVIDVGTEAIIWQGGFCTKITVDRNGEIDIYGDGLRFSFVKTDPNHIVLIPRLIATEVDG